MVSVGEAITDGYAAFNRGEIQGVLDLLSDDIEWHPVAEFPERQILRGRTQVIRHLARLVETWDELSMEPQKVIELPPHVVVLVHQRAKGGASGIEVEGDRAHAWTIKDDRAVRFASYADLDEALREVSTRAS